VLGGAAVAIGLPTLDLFLDSRGRALACGGVIPKRFGLFFWGNGIRPEKWVPSGEGTDWILSEELAPLVNVKDHLTVVSGMAVKIPNVYPHTSGAAGLLTGRDLKVDGSDTTYAGPTVDQLIAQSIGGNTVYQSLQTSASKGNGLSYNGPHSWNPAEGSPIALFQRIFGGSFHAPGDSAPVDPTLALRQSVLDAVLSDANTLKGKVGAADKARLDEHMDNIRQIELRLAKLQEDPPQLDACAVPPSPLDDYPDVDGRPQLTAVNQAMCDLIVMALACDQTRVFGHYFSDPVSDLLYTGTTAGHHDLTHNEADDQPQVNSITVQIMEGFAYLLEKMQSVQEGDTTLLDNSVVLGCSEVSLGQTHSINDMPIVLAGTACGKLKSGLHYRSYTQENASEVMLSLIRSMDIVAGSFGEDDGQATEGLSAIEV
jgi:hypothetical protein